MCTLTLVRAPWTDASEPTSALAWRVVFNRDERRSRRPGQPPVERTYGAARAVHPLDADHGGTWIAASSSGLVFALLNVFVRPETRGGQRSLESRGLIIPRLIESRATSLSSVPVEGIDPRRHLPFHLVIAGDRELVDVVSNGARLRISAPDGGTRVIRVSSSWQPRRVRAWRTRLFDALVPDASIAAQTAFHEQRSSIAGLGVEMTRPDAATVSVTTIEAGTRRFRMTYRSVEPRLVAEHEVSLPRD